MTSSRGLGFGLILALMAAHACDEPGSSRPEPSTSKRDVPTEHDRKPPTAEIVAAAPPKEAIAERAIKLPEYYGFYAVEKGTTVELVPGPWSGLDFSPNVEFIAYDKRILLDSNVRLHRLLPKNSRNPDAWKVAFYNRSKPASDPRREGGLDVFDNWERAAVACRVKPVEGKSEMVRLVPTADLQPGLYWLEGTRAYFSVQRESYVTSFLDNAEEGVAKRDWIGAFREVVICGTLASALGVNPGERAAGVLKRTEEALEAKTEEALDREEWSKVFDIFQEFDGLGLDASEEAVSKVLDRARQSLESGKWETALRGAQTALARGASNPNYAHKASALIAEVLFHDNGDGTILDREGGLLWAKAGYSVGSWAAVNEHCQKLDLGGFRDWRLPTHLEISALYDRIGHYTLARDHRAAPFEWCNQDYWTSEGGHRSLSSDDSGRSYLGDIGSSKQRHGARPVRFAKLEAGARTRLGYLGRNNTTEKATDVPLLLWAGAHGYSRIVEDMLKLGADPQPTMNGHSAMDWAAYNGHIDVVKILLPHAPRSEKAQLTEPDDPKLLSHEKTILVEPANWSEWVRFPRCERWQIVCRGLATIRNDAGWQLVDGPGIRTPGLNLRDVSRTAFSFKSEADQSVEVVMRWWTKR